MALGSVNALACGASRVEDPAYRAGAWTEHLGQPHRAPSADAVVPDDLTPWWRTAVGRAGAGAPALGDTLVAVLTVDNHLVLVHWEGGAVLWRRRLNAPGAGDPLLAQSRVYATTTGDEGTVFALDVRQGRTLWSQEVGPVAGPALLAGDRLLATTERGRVVALATGTGAVAWQARLRAPIRTGPVLVRDAALVATDDSLYLFATADGERRGAAPSPGAVLSPPAVAGDTIVLASPDGIVAGLDRDLTELWRVEVGEPIFGSPAVARDTVFVVTLGGRLWRIPLATPRRARAVALGAPVRTGPAPVRNGVLVGTVSGEVLFVRDSLLPAPRLRLDGPVTHPPLVHRGAILVVDGRGRVRTWR